MRELKKIIVAHPEYSRIISSIDFHFSRLRRKTINAKELSHLVWFGVEDIQKVFQLLTERYPRLFYLQGETGEILAIHSRYELKDGIRGLAKRSVDKSLKKEMLEPLITPVLAIIFAIFTQLQADTFQWLQELLLGKLLPGLPFFVFKGVVLVLLAFILFGSDVIIRKIPRAVYSFILTYFQGRDEGKSVRKKFDEAYEQWLKKENRTDPSFLRTS